MIWVILSIITAFALSMLPGSFHHINEGHVGIYYRGGALLPTMSESGFNVMVPIVTSYEEVQVTIQTDAVKSIPCGLSGGVMISFDRVEVVNRLSKSHVLSTVRRFGLNYDKMLVFDKIHHEINQFCSQHTLHEVYIDLFDTIDESLKETLQKDCEKFNTGIEIIAVRVTKPLIPESIRKTYEQMEQKKTEYFVALAHKDLAEKEQLTMQQQLWIEAERQADVARIQVEMQVQEKRSQQAIAALNNSMYLAKEMAKADAQLYKLKAEAAVNEKLLTDAFLENEEAKAIEGLKKIQFVKKLP